jgi:hypothetical protein
VIRQLIEQAKAGASGLQLELQVWYRSKSLQAAAWASVLRKPLVTCHTKDDMCDFSSIFRKHSIPRDAAVCSRAEVSRGAAAAVTARAAMTVVKRMVIVNGMVLFRDKLCD